MKEFLKKVLPIIITISMICCVACIILSVWGFDPILMLKTEVSSVVVVIFCMMLYSHVDKN